MPNIEALGSSKKRYHTLITVQQRRCAQINRHDYVTKALTETLSDCHGSSEKGHLTQTWRCEGSLLDLEFLRRILKGKQKLAC